MALPITSLNSLETLPRVRICGQGSEFNHVESIMNYNPEGIQ